MANKITTPGRREPPRRQAPPALVARSADVRRMTLQDVRASGCSPGRQTMPAGEPETGMVSTTFMSDVLSSLENRNNRLADIVDRLDYVVNRIGIGDVSPTPPGTDAHGVPTVQAATALLDRMDQLISTVRDRLDSIEKFV